MFEAIWGSGFGAEPRMALQLNDTLLEMHALCATDRDYYPRRTSPPDEKSMIRRAVLEPDLQSGDPRIVHEVMEAYQGITTLTPVPNQRGGRSNCATKGVPTRTSGL